MLRPSNSLLGSSRAARRANVRAERARALVQVLRSARQALSTLFSTALHLLMLLGLPLLYLAATYLVLDVPARWMAHRPAPYGGALFAAALAVCFVGVARAVQGAAPVAPVGPRFARCMLGLSFFAGLLLTIGDLAS